MIRSYIGLVANPKNGILCEVTAYGTRAENVGLHMADASTVGIGSIDTNNQSNDYASAILTGYPRAHVTTGVALPGLGFGTALYTAICLRARLNSRRIVPLGLVEADGDGISSMAVLGSRSSDASQWWDRAFTAGLTRRVVRRLARTDARMMPCGGLTLSEARANFIGEYDKISGCRVTIDASVDRDIKIDIYEASSAQGRGLIISYPGKNTTLDYDRRTCFLEAPANQIALNGIHENLSLDGILALNTGIYGKKHRQAVINIMKLAEMAGASSSQLRGLFARHEQGIDLEVEHDGDHDLVSRSRRILRSGTKTITNPGRGAWRPIHYGTVRNPPDKRLQKNIDELAERRTALGWNKLSALP